MNPPSLRLLALFVLVAPFLTGCEAIRSALNTPQVAFTSPTPGTVVDGDEVRVNGTIQSPSALTALTWSLNGEPATSGFNGWDAATNTFTLTVTGLEPGNNVLTVAATNIQGYTGSAALTIRRRDDVPEVAFLEPADGERTTAESIRVRGTVTDDYGVRSATLRVNDGSAINVLPLLDDEGGFEADVALETGENTLLLRAIDTSDQAAEMSITVIREPEDATAFGVSILSPADGSQVVAPALLVEGEVTGTLDVTRLEIIVDEDEAFDLLDALDEDRGFRFELDGLEAGTTLALRVVAQSETRTAEASVLVTVVDGIDPCPSLLANGGAEAFVRMEENGPAKNEDSPTEPGPTDPTTPEPTEPVPTTPDPTTPEPSEPDPSETGTPDPTTPEPTTPGPAIALATGWELISGALLSVGWDSAAGLPSALSGPSDRGDRHFAAEGAGTVRARQEIDLANLSEEIGAGAVQLDVEGWFGVLAGSEDTVRLRVLLRGEGRRVDELLLGPVRDEDLGDGQALVRRAASMVIPEGVDELRVELIFEDEDADGIHEAFADALRLELSSGGVCLDPAAEPSEPGGTDEGSGASGQSGSGTPEEHSAG